MNIIIESIMMVITHFSRMLSAQVTYCSIYLIYALNQITFSLKFSSYPTFLNSGNTIWRIYVIRISPCLPIAWIKFDSYDNEVFVGPPPARFHLARHRGEGGVTTIPIFSG